MKESFHKKCFVINAAVAAGKKSKIVKPNRQTEEKMPIRKIFIYRKIKGEFRLLTADLKLYDHNYLKSFWMSLTRYEELLGVVAPLIIKSNQRRESIRPSKRLRVTLGYLVTGDSPITIWTSFRKIPACVGRSIKELSGMRWNILTRKGYVKCIDNMKK